MKIVLYLNKRAWLNPLARADTGSIIAHANIMLEEGKYYDHTSFLKIRDCSRSIELNFSCERTKASVNRRRRKIKKMRDHLDVIEKGLDKFEELL